MNLPDSPERYRCIFIAGERMILDTVFSDDDMSGVLRMAQRHAHELGSTTGFITAKAKPPGFQTEYAEVEILLRRTVSGLRIDPPTTCTLTDPASPNETLLQVGDDIVDRQPLTGMPPAPASHAPTASAQFVRLYPDDIKLTEHVAHQLDALFAIQHFEGTWSPIPDRVTLRSGSLQLTFPIRVTVNYEATLAPGQHLLTRTPLQRAAERHDETRDTDDWRWYALRSESVDPPDTHGFATPPCTYRATTFREAALHRIAEQHSWFEPVLPDPHTATTRVTDDHDARRRVLVKHTRLPFCFSVGTLYSYGFDGDNFLWEPDDDPAQNHHATHLAVFRPHNQQPMFSCRLNVQQHPRDTLHRIATLLLHLNLPQTAWDTEHCVFRFVASYEDRDAWMANVEFHHAWRLELSEPDAIDLAEAEDALRGYPDEPEISENQDNKPAKTKNKSAAKSRKPKTDLH